MFFVVQLEDIDMLIFILNRQLSELAYGESEWTILRN
jgi:hypothetical protein